MIYKELNKPFAVHVPLIPALGKKIPRNFGNKDLQNGQPHTYIQSTWCHNGQLGLVNPRSRLDQQHSSILPGAAWTLIEDLLFLQITCQYISIQICGSILGAYQVCEDQRESSLNDTEVVDFASKSWISRNPPLSSHRHLISTIHRSLDV